MNEPNIVATIDAIFQSDHAIDAEFGVVYDIGGSGKVLYATTETWNSQPQLMSKKGFIYIYSDYKKTADNKDVAGMKCGDGTSYLIDMPFTDAILYEHMNDLVSHVTQEEKNFWNNKVRCYVVDDGISKELIFTTE